jgi:hypothetical protein
MELYLPDVISMSIISLTKAVTGDRGKVSYGPAETYLEFEKDFERRLSSGWFTNPEVEIDGIYGGFDSLLFDSSTTLLDLIMDRILQIQNRPGKFPEQDDWTIQMDAFRRIVRNATATGLYVAFTAHEEMAKGKLDNVVANQLMFTGKLKQKIPLLFSDIYHTKAEKDRDGKIHYYIDTVPESLYPLARCSLNIPSSVDVTYPVDCSDPTLFGIGKILREKGKWPIAKLD